MSETALLVIDGQESFRRAPYWSEVDLGTLVGRFARIATVEETSACRPMAAAA